MRAFWRAVHRTLSVALLVGGVAFLATWGPPAPLPPKGKRESRRSKFCAAAGDLTTCYARCAHPSAGANRQDHAKLAFLFSQTCQANFAGQPSLNIPEKRRSL